MNQSGRRLATDEEDAAPVTIFDALGRVVRSSPRRNSVECSEFLNGRQQRTGVAEESASR